MSETCLKTSDCQSTNPKRRIYEASGANCFFKMVTRHEQLILPKIDYSAHASTNNYFHPLSEEKDYMRYPMGPFNEDLIVRIARQRQARPKPLPSPVISPVVEDFDAILSSFTHADMPELEDAFPEEQPVSDEEFTARFGYTPDSFDYDPNTFNYQQEDAFVPCATTTSNIVLKKPFRYKWERDLIPIDRHNLAFPTSTEMPLFFQGLFFHFFVLIMVKPNLFFSHFVVHDVLRFQGQKF